MPPREKGRPRAASNARSARAQARGLAKSSDDYGRHSTGAFVADGLSGQLQQPAIVENMGDAGGMTANRVTKAERTPRTSGSTTPRPISRQWR